MSNFTSDEFSDIIHRFFKYKWYKPVYEVLSDPVLFIGTTFLFPAVFFLIIFGPVYITLILTFAVGIFGIALNLWVEKQMKKYEIFDNEFTAYYSWQIIQKLGRRKGAKPAVQEDYNKEAIREVKDFLKIIYERWTVGKFKLIQDSFAQPLKEFKLGLKFRVIPSLKQNNEKEAEIIKDAFTTLKNNCKNLQLSNIIDFNRSISVLPDKTPSISGTFRKSWYYINNHRTLRWSLYVGGILLLCFLVATVSYFILKVQLEYVYGGSIAIFIALLELLVHKSKSSISE